MAKTVTIEEVKRIAQLAHMDISDSEAERYTKQIASILEYVEMLNEVDTKGLEFKSQTDLVNVFHEDVSQKSLTQEKVVQNRKKSSKRGNLVISSVL